MADSVGDVAALFTPEEGPSSLPTDLSKAATPHRESTPTHRDASEPRTELAPFYIDLSELDEPTREKYRESDLPIVDDDYDEDAAEVVTLNAELRFGEVLYIYGLYGDNLYRRKFDYEWKEVRPDLYEEYLRLKAKGKLKNIDPMGHNVHPRSRINISRIKATRTRARQDRSRRLTRGDGKRQEYYETDEEGSSDESSMSQGASDSDEYNGYHSRRTQSRASRRGKYRSRELPFSPRKLRARPAHRLDLLSDSEEEGESDEDYDSEKTPTRTLRSRASKKIRYAEKESDYDDDDYEDSRDNRRVRKKKIRRKAPKPAYGRIRVVEDLNDSDGETAPLRAHRGICEKCHRQPAHILARKKKKGRKKKNADEFSEDEDEAVQNLGGWVRCLKCCVAAHWRCLARTQQGEILKAAKALSNDPDFDRKTLEANETTEFLCGSCTKGGYCMICDEVAISPDPSMTENSKRAEDARDERSSDREVSASEKSRLPSEAVDVTHAVEPASELLFRCFTCKRLAHYSELPYEDDDEDVDAAEKAFYYQKTNHWRCHDCSSFVYDLDKILAWRPTKGGLVEERPDSVPDHRSNLPREYLVKWADRSYRRTQWVPHMWLLATHQSKLKNFLSYGPNVAMLKKPRNDEDDNMSVGKKAIDATDLPIFQGDDPDASQSSDETSRGPPSPLEQAELYIPRPWITVDRVLDVLLWAPMKTSSRSKESKGRVRSEEDDQLEQWPEEVSAEKDAAFDSGEMPSDRNTETLDEFEARVKRRFGEEDIGKVVFALIKWEDLGYDEATWDSPPRLGELGYDAFHEAALAFISARSVVVPKLSRQAAEKLESRDGRKEWTASILGVPEGDGYDIGQAETLKLMDFQINGVNWLCHNWFFHQQCILADEMGLGKTVQIVTFLGLLHAKIGVCPSLVVVPNSTITNWVREFHRWAPRLRVVPYYGEAKAREIVKKYELYHRDRKLDSGMLNLKFHVLVTTYDTAINLKDFGSVFKPVPRWEVLVVDEGQRLKSDSSLLFKRLRELKSYHRVIMTGTPINNNIRELFNLMNFLDPHEWNNLESLEKEYADLNDDLVKEMHERLRPYFLRRIKAEVLKLPPKNEVIVPVTMTSLQREIYKSILSKNAHLLQSLTRALSSHVNKSAANKSNMNNILMQLRKCLQHPYLISDDIEPKGLDPAEAHSKLIDASAKLRLLKGLLPKLKERGHRVLLFSQFVIALDIIEDFLRGEKYKFLRLDGGTKQSIRQKDMDEFNREGSDVFIYILSTRAGGVGINLWSADTVIIFDPDFNPHQDLQAISRSHRFGQTKTCLVFKLMVKDSAEEKIMQAGKKKLVLDHLIVQKMDDEEAENNVQSILTYGAKALFEESNGQPNRDINYSEADLENLIKKTEVEGDEVQSNEAANNAFSFAKVFFANKNALEDLPDDNTEDNGADSWAQTLAKIAASQGNTTGVEKSGRGARRKATRKVNYIVDYSPEKIVQKASSSSSLESDDEYMAKEEVSSSSDEESQANPEQDVVQVEANELMTKPKVEIKPPVEKPAVSVPFVATPQQTALQNPIAQPSTGDDTCGLCKNSHGPGQCLMTQRPENLVEYRSMLIYYAKDEPWDERLEAIKAIDEALHRRGLLHLVKSQPVMAPGGPSMPVRSVAQNNPSRVPIGPRNTAETGNQALASVYEAKHAASLNQKAPKRAGSPGLTQIQQKKPKHHSVCAICKQSPVHDVLYCPEVRKGPQYVLRAIKNLSTESGHHAETIAKLKAILRQQKRLANERAMALQPPPPAQ